jgi:hypothetical protein
MLLLDNARHQTLKDALDHLERQVPSSGLLHLVQHIQQQVNQTSYQPCDVTVVASISMQKLDPQLDEVYLIDTPQLSDSQLTYIITKNLEHTSDADGIIRKFDAPQPCLNASQLLQDLLVDLDLDDPTIEAAVKALPQ